MGKCPWHVCVKSVLERRKGLIFGVTVTDRQEECWGPLQPLFPFLSSLSIKIKGNPSAWNTKSLCYIYMSSDSTIFSFNCITPFLSNLLLSREILSLTFLQFLSIPLSSAVMEDEWREKHTIYRLLIHAHHCRKKVGSGGGGTEGDWTQRSITYSISRFHGNRPSKDRGLQCILHLSISYTYCDNETVRETNAKVTWGSSPVSTSTIKEIT